MLSLQNNLEVDQVFLPELKPGINLFIGPSGTGKTYALQAIISRTHQQYDNFFVISRTSDTLYQWERFFMGLGRKVAGFDEIPDQFIAWLEDKQDQRFKQGKRKLKLFIIFDDVLGSISKDKQVQMRNDDMFKYLCYNGRHLSIYCCICTQSYIGISPDQSQSAQTSFLWPVGSYSTLETYTFPRFLDCTQDQFPQMRNMTPTQRKRVWHNLFGSLRDYECIFRDKTANKYRLHKFLAKL